jgi:signal transduction histidine kinase
VRVDRVQLREAIDGLVANAAAAMPGGGTLSVFTSREMLKGVPYVLIRIQDTGEGIAAENLDRVFEPFFTTRISPRGTGLGLPLAKKIIEEEGGTIRIESVKGAGTVVTLRFPDVRPA